MWTFKRLVLNKLKSSNPLMLFVIHLLATKTNSTNEIQIHHLIEENTLSHKLSPFTEKDKRRSKNGFTLC